MRRHCKNSPPATTGSRLGPVGLALLLGGATGCGSLLAEGFESGLTPAAGCQDLRLVANDPEGGTVLVFWDTSGPLARLRNNAAAIIYDIGSSDDAAIFFVETGDAPWGGLCGLAGEPQIELRYHLISGTANLSLGGSLGSETVTLALTDWALQKELADHRITAADTSLTWNVDW